MKTRPRTVLLALALASLALLVGVSLALAGKSAEGAIGATGTEGGLFRDPADIAVRQSSGQIYVADSANNRIQRLDSAGNFERAWGRGVVKPGGAGDVPGASERQTVTALGSGGTFTLRAPDGGMAPLTSATSATPSRHSPSPPAAAPSRLPSETPSTTPSAPPPRSPSTPAPRRSNRPSKRPPHRSPTSTPATSPSNGPAEGPWQIEFAEPGLGYEPGLSADASNLTGSPKSAIALFGPDHRPDPPRRLRRHLDSALEALSLIGPGNVSVTGPDGGPWQVEFTGALADADVRELSGDATNLTGDPKSVSVDEGAQASAPFEICTVAAQCRGGFAGTLGGELRAPAHLALNQATGHLYVSDENNRITEFDADGNFIRLWGANVVQPGGVGDNPTNEQKRIFFAYPASRTSPSAAPSNSDSKARAPPRSPITPPPRRSSPPSRTSPTSPPPTSRSPPPRAAPGPLSSPAPTPTPRSTSRSTPPASSPPSAARKDAYVETLIAAGGFEVCTVASQCKAGVFGSDLHPPPPAPASSAAPSTSPSAPPATSSPPTPPTPASSNTRPTATSSAPGAGASTPTPTPSRPAPRPAAAKAAAPRPPTPTPPGELPRTASSSVSLPPESTFKAGKTPTAIAVDAAGVLYAAAGDHAAGASLGNNTGLSPRIDRFDSTATAPADLLLPNPIRSQNPYSGATPGPLPDGSHPVGLESDPGDGHLYYLTAANVAAQGIYEIDPSTDPAGAVDVHLPGFGGLGLGYAEGSDRLYVSTVTNLGIRHRVIVVDDDTAPAAPAASMDAPQVTGPSSATFGGEVTPAGPDGIATSYRFEYRKLGAPAWESLPPATCNSGCGTGNPSLAQHNIDLGSANSPLAVTQSITTLEPGSTYEVRLHAEKEFGLGSTTTPAQQFAIADLPPTVETLYPQRRGDTEATLSGRVNPQNLETTYHFEFGPDTDYGQDLPVPEATIPADSGDRPIDVAVDVEGLSPNTTYHYRLVASNGAEVAPGDTTVEGADVAFTTPGALPDTSPQRPFEMVTPPFKVVRAAVKWGAALHLNPNPGLPSLNGDTVAWQAALLPAHRGRRHARLRRPADPAPHRRRAGSTRPSTP